jgi:predicted nucleotide-binding protein
MMEQADPQILLQQLLDSAESLSYRDGNAIDSLLRRVEMVIRKVFGPNSKYLTDLSNIHFYPMYAPSSEEARSSSWRSGSRSLKNMIGTMQEELKLFGSPGAVRAEQRISKPSSKDIFVVHGHDEAMKANVARTLEKLGLTPIILHEKPNQGRTIIEKFTDYSAVGFAIALLSPDDVGRLGSAPPEQLWPRARQNVIFELGFFIGRLGRDHVLALFAPVDQFELPSDYSGVLFVPYDSSGRWQFDLVKELKAADYDVDANTLINN